MLEASASLLFGLHKASVVDEGLPVHERFGKPMPKGMTSEGWQGKTEGFLCLLTPLQGQPACGGTETIRLYPGHPFIMAILVQTKKQARNKKADAYGLRGKTNDEPEWFAPI